MQVKQYDGTGPKLDIFEYFQGNSRAWGIFTDRGGALKRQFAVDIVGSVDGDKL